MALDKTTLKNDIKAMREVMKTKSDATQADEYYASQLADIIDKYVKTATVTVIAATGDISVQGTATTQTNVAPITIKGTPVTGGLS